MVRLSAVTAEQNLDKKFPKPDFFDSVWGISVVVIYQP